ncbi:MAG TPA: hypothetical protein VIV54_25025 [Burkholderiales bacterium]
MNRTPVVRGGSRQAFQIKAPIDFGEEAGRAIVAALDYVQRYAGDFEARRSSHTGSTRHLAFRFIGEFVTGKLL